MLPGDSTSNAGLRAAAPDGSGDRQLRVVLIQPSEPFGKNALIPQSLLELAAILRDAAISVEILDARLDDLSVHETIDLLRRKACDVVGITGLGNAYRYIKDFAFEFKREFPDVPLMAGGHFIMTVPEPILRRVPIDVACTGEGDEIIVELVRRLAFGKPLDGIPNIAYLQDGELKRTEFKLVSDLDRLPLPAYELLAMDRYQGNSEAIGGFYVTTGRGCVHHCYYCGSLYNKVRRLSPERLVELFDLLHDTYGVGAFMFSDENSFYPQRWLVEVCAVLNKLGRGYDLHVAGCPDHVTEDACRALASLKGRASVSIAVEHWNPEIQRKFYRVHQSKSIERALDLFRRYAIPNRGMSILWGHPDDTLESFSESFRTSLEIQVEYEIKTLSVRALLVVPNSRFYGDAMRLRKIVDYEDFMYATTGYAPFVNLTEYDDDRYRLFIAQLWYRKVILFSPDLPKKLKCAVASAVLTAAVSLPRVMRKPFRAIIERLFMAPMYKPEVRYYHDLACCEEILRLPRGARVVAGIPRSRVALSRMLNSVREAGVEFLGFAGVDSGPRAAGSHPVYQPEELSALGATHVILPTCGDTVATDRIRKACHRAVAVTADCSGRRGKREVMGKGLDTWFTLEEARILLRR